MDAAATAQLREEEPLGQFNGFGTYIDRNHLAFAELGEIFRNADGLGDALARIYNLPLYKALAFTITYCLLVTPLARFVDLDGPLLLAQASCSSAQHSPRHLRRRTPAADRR